MSGWSSSGTRVYLGASHSYEKRDFIVYVWGEPSSVTPRKRLVTLERAEWRGLTEAGAESKTPTAGWTIVARDRVDESNQWRVNEEKETLGDWESV